MIALFHALTERVKALFVTSAALDFEAELLAHDAERQAELLRQAQHYEDEGLHGIAQRLRQQVETLSLQRPLATVLPAVEHLLGTNSGTDKPLNQALLPNEPSDILPFTNDRPRSRKKGK